jgi:hypothetical protein
LEFVLWLIVARATVVAISPDVFFWLRFSLLRSLFLSGSICRRSCMVMVPYSKRDPTGWVAPQAEFVGFPEKVCLTNGPQRQLGRSEYDTGFRWMHRGFVLAFDLYGFFIRMNVCPWSV